MTPRAASFPRLLWITPERGPIEAMVEAAHAGLPGGCVLLLRRPGLSAAMLFDEARRFARTSVPLLISARVDVAMAAGAAGMHLPERGHAPEEVRALWPDALIGVSRHDRAGFAQVEGADYATLSPFAPTPGKGPALPLETFRQAVEASPIPVLALGGVHAGNTEAALRAGAQGIAFIRAAQAVDPAAMRAAVIEMSEQIRAISRELDPASNLGE